MAESAALTCIERAFAEIIDVHDRMSFHQPMSELSIINHNAHIRPMPVSEGLSSVLGLAHELSSATDGVFDVTIAPELVASRLLPNLTNNALPQGTWRDVHLRSDGSVFFRRPLWIDLGGIAKGYAVDRAIASLREAAVPAAIVNAGGDIGVLGSITEQVLLRVDGKDIGDSLPLIEISEGSLASSSTTLDRGTHLDGRTRTALSDTAFVAVAAPECIAADALTKVVLASGFQYAHLLNKFGAQAFCYTPGAGWRQSE